VSPAELLLFLGTAVFAVTGVLGAARHNMDVMSFVIVGIVTAIGGGTLRDLMLDQPLFWLARPAFLYVAAGAAVATFFLEQRFRATLRGFLYLDAIATAVYTILAIENTLRLGFTMGVAVVMGVITGIGGGIIRDLVTGQPTLLMRRELYMTPILLGGVLFVVLKSAGLMETRYAAAFSILTIAAVRLGAIRWNWAFPEWLTYRPLR
jgi:uncharacterized membrane protein YeiH